LSLLQISFSALRSIHLVNATYTMGSFEMARNDGK